MKKTSAWKREEFIKEIAIVGGFISVIVGLWLINPALALVIGGALLIWFGLPGKVVR